MKPFGLLALATVFCVAVAQGQLVLLGDSLSDNGNGYAANTKLVLQTNETYPVPPYYQGRWSNGPVWIEVAAQQLGVSLADYGAAGATTGVVPAQVPPLQPPFAGLTLPTTVLSPNIYQQLNSLLLATNNTLNPDSVYIILIGANDFLSTVFANSTNTAQNTFSNIQNITAQLYAHGARKFLFAAVPSLSALPVFTQPATYGYYSNASIMNVDTQVMNLNMMLQGLVSNLRTTYPGSTPYYFDFGSTFMQFVNNAQAYGVTNIMTACYVTAPDLNQNLVPTAQPIGAPGGQECSDPDNHLFWDQFHPTRVVHEYIGASFASQFGPALFGRTMAPAPSSARGQAPQLPTLAAGK